MGSFFRLIKARLFHIGVLHVLSLLMLIGCGRDENLVLISVDGLDPAITELSIAMPLDGSSAHNLQPTADDPNPNSFSVYKDMRSFGIEIPPGTQTLGIDIKGLTASRAVEKAGSGQLTLSQSKDLNITLQ